MLQTLFVVWENVTEKKLLALHVLCNCLQFDPGHVLPVITKYAFDFAVFLIIIFTEVKSDVLKDLRNLPSFSIMFDETTLIGAKNGICFFICYVALSSTQTTTTAMRRATRTAEMRCNFR